MAAPARSRHHGGVLSLRRVAAAFAAGCLLALAGVPARAQSPIGTLISQESRTTFTVEGAGARAMGLGGAFTAVADDATAVSFNPAGLAQLMDPEVSFVGRGLNQGVEYQDFQTTGQGRQLAVSDSLNTRTRFDPLFLSATAPVRVAGRNLVFQLSIQRAFALGESDRRDLEEMPLATGAGSPSHLHQAISQSGQIDLYSFALAYEVSQRILLGLAWNQWRGRWDLSSSASEVVGLTRTSLAFQQTNALDGTNFNLGLIWRWPTWSLGLVRRTGFHADYTFATGVQSDPVLPHLPDGQPYETGLHWPASTSLGLAYRPGERWLLAADLTHTLWSTARYMSTRPALNGQSFFDFDKVGRTPDATDLHLGLEYLYLTAGNAVIPLRMGLSREPQPVVDAVTGNQRVMYSAAVGTGFKRGPYGVDVAYRYGWSRRQTSQFLEIDQILDHQRATSIGTERITEHRLDLSFIVQFHRAPVERALHHLFVGD